MFRGLPDQPHRAAGPPPNNLIEEPTAPPSEPSVRIERSPLRICGFATAGSGFPFCGFFGSEGGGGAAGAGARPVAGAAVPSRSIRIGRSVFRVCGFATAGSGFPFCGFFGSEGGGAAGAGAPAGGPPYSSRPSIQDREESPQPPDPPSLHQPLHPSRPPENAKTPATRARPLGPPPPPPLASGTRRDRGASAPGPRKETGTPPMMTAARSRTGGGVCAFSHPIIPNSGAIVKGYVSRSARPASQSRRPAAEQAHRRTEHTAFGLRSFRRPPDPSSTLRRQSNRSSPPLPLKSEEPDYHMRRFTARVAENRCVLAAARPGPLSQPGSAPSKVCPCSSAAFWVAALLPPGGQRHL